VSGESEKVEIVRGLYADWKRGEFGRGEDEFDPDVEFIIDGEVTLGSGMRSQGFSSIGKTWREYLSDWGHFRTGEIEKVYESADQVVVLSTLHMRGRASGIEISELEAGAIFTFRNGRIARLHLVRREHALEAAGIDPSP
jgi:ketosteroid isomerase-like protein